MLGPSPGVPLHIRVEEASGPWSGECHIPPAAHRFGPWPYWPSSVGSVPSSYSPSPLLPELAIVQRPWPAAGPVRRAGRSRREHGHVVARRAVGAVPTLQKQDRFWHPGRHAGADAAPPHGDPAVVLSVDANQLECLEHGVGDLASVPWCSFPPPPAHCPPFRREAA